jgi:hypothetical protein
MWVLISPDEISDKIFIIKIRLKGDAFMNQWNNQSSEFSLGSQLRVEIRPLMRQVYMWMLLAMLVTMAVSVVVANLPSVFAPLMTGPVVIGIFIAQIAIVLVLSFAFNRLSAQLATILFFVYAGTMGFTLTLILLAYSGASVLAALASTTALFGVMTVFGLTTKMDLSKWGTYLLIGLIGLIVASIINIFLASSAVEFIISLIGVVIFTALTAYDTQQIMRMAADPQINAQGEATLTKLSILGALRLYLDFINLFLYLLRLFGSRD